MARLHSLSEEHLRVRLAQLEADRRHERSVLWTAVALLLLWPLLGLALMALGLTSTHPVLGPLSFQVGVYVANLGILGTVLWAWRQSER